MIKLILVVLVGLCNHSIAVEDHDRPVELESLKLSSLVIFGDEMSDDGSLNRSSHGGSKFSDGPVWGEYLHKMTHAHHYVNFAVPGATAITFPSEDPRFHKSSLQTQINTFNSWVKSHPDFEPEETVVVIALGHNDFMVDPSIRDSNVVSSLRSGVENLLNNYKFKRILIAGSMLPDSKRVSLDAMTLRLTEVINLDYFDEKSDVRFWTIPDTYVDELIFPHNGGIFTRTMSNLLGSTWRHQLGQCLVDLIPDHPSTSSTSQCHRVTDRLLLDNRYFRTEMHEVIARSGFNQMQFRFPHPADVIKSIKRHHA